MLNRVQFCVTSTVETALKKLNKVNIAVYCLKKHGVNVYFEVEEEYTQKVFAIFAHPCYNTVIRRKSVKMRLAHFMRRRFGLAVGALLFVCACVLADRSVLKIKVVGNGDYLSPQINAIARECGADIFSPVSRVDKPMLTSAVLALPDVTFCSVQSRGNILLIEVNTEADQSITAEKKPLISSVDGEVYKIVALSGTAEVAAGDTVAVGQTLIGAYRLTEEGERQDTLAVGFAEIKRTASILVHCDCESKENEKRALSAVALYSDRVLEKSFKVSPTDGGVSYNVTFTYLVTVSLNIE